MSPPKTVTSRSHSLTELAPEICFYLVHFIVFYFWIVPTIGGHVAAKCHGYWQCHRFIHTTWWNYDVDLADNQWRELRGSLALLWTAMIGISVSHFVFWRIWRGSDKSGGATVSAWFRLVTGLIFLAVQHGRQSLVVLLICYLGYRISQWQRDAKAKTGLATWLFAIAVLLFKESYRLQHLPEFHFLAPIFDHAHGGMYNWRLPANFLVLRIISFGMDYHWALTGQEIVDSDKGVENDKDKGERGETTGRSETRHRHSEKSFRKTGTVAIGGSPMSNDGVSGSAGKLAACQGAESDGTEVKRSRPLSEYNFVNYLSYVLYAPLYVAGPVISFNAFAHNTHHPQVVEDPVKYGLRWILCLGLMEFLTSRFPFFAVIASGLFPYLSPAELAITAYMTLKMMWLKFLIVWRFFRLWAMTDGTLTPENMLRCMSNNCSLEQFWRGWHSSFNKWIVRYMYKPLGGRTVRVWAVWPIFLFVAIWHDIEMKLLIWGLLNSVFFVIEIFAKRFASSPAMQSLPTKFLRFIFILSGATYILVLVGVNLIGYAVGVSGVTVILDKLATWNGAQVLFLSYYFLSVAVAGMAWLQRIGISKP